MNARQKAKALKKELEHIKSIPFKRDVYRVIDIPTQHLKACCVIPINELKRYDKDMLEKVVRYELASDLIGIIEKNMVINQEESIDTFMSTKYSTDIWVAFGRK